MSNLTDLSTLIQTENTHGFLSTYLDLIANGYTLSIPTQTNLNEIKEGWEQILPQLANDFSDTFLDQISRTWQNLLLKQGGELTDDFAETMLSHLVVKKPSTKEKKPIPSAKPLDTTPYPTIIPRAHPKPVETEVESNISENYYDYKTAETHPIPSKKELVKLSTAAILSEDENGFLIHHLSYVKHNQTPVVPISTVPEMIKGKWEEIFLTQYKTMPTETFLEKVSNRWFYLVNQKKLPTSKAIIEDLLYTLLSDYTPPKPTSASKKGLLSKLFKK